jgi:uncharacterized repeat protein (TIGR03803 family)
MRRSAAFAAALVVLFYFGYAALHAAAAITLLHEFAGGANDGREPLGRLTLSGSTLYGTARYGGDPCPVGSAGCGMVFSMNTDGSGFTLLHNFVGGANDGDRPHAGLTLSGPTLFGTTSQGGDGCLFPGCGTIFSINTVGSGFTLLHEFGGGDGEFPGAGLTLSGSTLYGTTINGGNNNLGTVFSINTDGSGFTLLHEFAGGANDGWRPESDLTISGLTLYGTTSLGGANNRGTIFSINTNGSGYTPLHEFAGGANDGDSPLAGLTLSGSTLYGTTQGGGDNGRGTIFSINTNGSGFTLLHEFAGGADDGSLGLFILGTPRAGLTLSGSTLYGATDRGGDFNFGTVFSIEIAEPGLPGNNNGTVDAADYVLWRKNTSQSYEAWRILFGQSAVSTPVDFNNDHNVDTADYVVWRKTMQAGYNIWTTNFAESSGDVVGSAGVSSSQTTVPEPASLLLFVLGVVACGLRIRSEKTAEAKVRGEKLRKRKKKVSKPGASAVRLIRSAGGYPLGG